MIGALIARQAVKSGFDALNDRDLDKFLKAWSEQSIWIYPGSLSVSGKHVGKANVKKWFAHFQEQFPQIRFNLKHLGVGSIFAFGGNNIISAHWDLALTNKTGIEYQYNGVTVLVIKGGKVVQGEDFLFKSSGEDFSKMWGE